MISLILAKIIVKDVLYADHSLQPPLNHYATEKLFNLLALAAISSSGLSWPHAALWWKPGTSEQTSKNPDFTFMWWMFLGKMLNSGLYFLCFWNFLNEHALIFHCLGMV